MLSQQRSTEIPLALFVAMCLIGAELGQAVVVPVGGLALPALWPLSGVLVAALILADRRRWGMLVASACGAMILSAAVVHGRPVLPSVGLSVIFGFEASATAWLVQRTIDRPFALNRVPHTWALAASSALVPIAGGLLAANVLALTDLSPFPAAWPAWWLADAIGMLVTAPMVIAAIAERSAFGRVVRPWKALEIAIVFISGSLVAVSIFGNGLDRLVRVPAYILPFLLWPVLRFGPGGSAAALFVVALVGLWNAAQGQGPLAVVGMPITDLVLRSQGAMTIAGVSFLLLASVVAERKRVAQEYAALVAELQQALAEIKTLRGFIPICAWCHRVRDDAGFWQQIEKYLDARTDATFSHSICPACEDLAQEEIASHPLSDRPS